jgi:hypothetical protein
MKNPGHAASVSKSFVINQYSLFCALVMRRVFLSAPINITAHAIFPKKPLPGVI